MQRVTRLLLDPARCGERVLLRLQVPNLRSYRGVLRLQLVNLLALGDVLANRVGEAERNGAEDDGEHRRSARELGVVAGEIRPGEARCPSACWLGGASSRILPLWWLGRAAAELASLALIRALARMRPRYGNGVPSPGLLPLTRLGSTTPRIRATCHCPSAADLGNAARPA